MTDCPAKHHRLKPTDEIHSFIHSFVFYLWIIYWVVGGLQPTTSCGQLKVRYKDHHSITGPLITTNNQSHSHSNLRFIWEFLILDCRRKSRRHGEKQYTRALSLSHARAHAHTVYCNNISFSVLHSLPLNYMQSFKSTQLYCLTTELQCTHPHHSIARYSIFF